MVRGFQTAHSQTAAAAQQQAQSLSPFVVGLPPQTTGKNERPSLLPGKRADVGGQKRCVVTILVGKPRRAWPRRLKHCMGRFLKSILLWDLFQGLWVTFRNQNPRYIYTEHPTERPKLAERYRGAPRLNVNPDTNDTLCISCNLCALACPENLIVVTSVRNEETRRKDLTTFTYDLSRCMFCGLCEDACPVDALELTQDFELAS